MEKIYRELISHGALFFIFFIFTAPFSGTLAFTLLMMSFTCFIVDVILAVINVLFDIDEKFDLI